MVLFSHVSWPRNWSERKVFANEFLKPLCEIFCLTDVFQQGKEFSNWKVSHYIDVGGALLFFTKIR